MPRDLKYRHIFHVRVILIDTISYYSIHKIVLLFIQDVVLFNYTELINECKYINEDWLQTVALITIARITKKNTLFLWKSLGLGKVLKLKPACGFGKSLFVLLNLDLFDFGFLRLKV